MSMPPMSEPPLPLYGTASLADLVPSLLHALDVPGMRNPLGVEPLRRVCVLVVDGLGWELLRRHRRQAPFLGSLIESGSALTAGFPATTASSLGSIGTGLAPGEHGLLGYTMAVPGYDRAMNVLRWSLYGAGPHVGLLSDVVPEDVQPQPTAFERAASDGVEVSLVGPMEHAQSGMTRAVLRGGSYRPAFSLGDLAAEASLALSHGRRSFVYAYDPALDATGHVRGVSSDAWRLHLRHVDHLAATLAERLPRDSALVVTGDHGMVDLAEEQRVDLADHPELAAGVRLLAGEARARHVYTTPGAAEDVRAAWSSVLGDRMWVVSRDEAIEAGWFGPRVPDAVRPRVGDVVAAAFGPVGVVERAVDANQARFAGHHGSMTPEEQLVPFLVAQP